MHVYWMKHSLSSLISSLCDTLNTHELYVVYAGMQISKLKSCVSLLIPFNFIEKTIDFNYEMSQSTTAMQ